MVCPFRHSPKLPAQNTKTPRTRVRVFKKKERGRIDLREINGERRRHERLDGAPSLVGEAIRAGRSLRSVPPSSGYFLFAPLFNSYSQSLFTGFVGIFSLDVLQRNLDQLEALSKKLKAKTLRAETPTQSIAATRYDSNVRRI